jgi:hypothetical protein
LRETRGKRGTREAREARETRETRETRKKISLNFLVSLYAVQGLAKS